MRILCNGFSIHILPKKIQFARHSTGLSLGNLVDGLPGALHNTEAVWRGQGAFGPAAIDTLDKTKDRKCLKP